MMRKKLKWKGFTLPEVIVGILIIGIFILVATGFFAPLATGLVMSKTRLIITHLAQEKLDHFKTMPYHRILPTKQSDIDQYGYDNTYYLPERNLLVGERLFDRYVLIRKTDETGADLPPDHEDTGMKKITVYIKWTDPKGEKIYTVSTIIKDTERKPPNSKFHGVVRTIYDEPIPNARVVVEENPFYNDYTDENGQYEIHIPSGTWSLKVSSLLFFDVKITTTLADGEIRECNFTMHKKNLGSAKGDVYKRTNLVISEVCPAYTPVDGTSYNELLEYIELYNPTTFPITINNQNFKLKYVDSNNKVNEIPLTFITNTVPANGGYFLIASTPIVRILNTKSAYSYVLANATYSALIDSTKRGGICITDNYDVWIDSLAWGAMSGGNLPPPAAVETEGYKFWDRQGIGANCSLERRSHAPPAISWGGPHDLYGNAFDSDNNSKDFVFNYFSSNLTPQNTGFIENPISGKPVNGALVFCSDGISSPAITKKSPRGEFYISNIATGTWRLDAFDPGSGLSGTRTVVISDESPVINQHIILNQISKHGYITGRVRSGGIGLGIGLEGITVRARSTSVRTDAFGHYRLKLIPGEYIVTANPDNENLHYTTASTTYTVIVKLGRVVSDVNFTLYPGGKIQGRIVTQNNDPLPHIVVEARDLYNNVWTAVSQPGPLSGSGGLFTITNLRKFVTYRVRPILELSESSNPPQVNITLSQNEPVVWVATFTITNAMGKFWGEVKYEGKKITTGVLIIASTDTTISPTNPPMITNTRIGTPPYYFMITSNEKGTYELPVIGYGSSATYKIIAWYTCLEGNRPVTRYREVTGATVPAGGRKKIDFTSDWILMN